MVLKPLTVFLLAATTPAILGTVCNCQYEAWMHEAGRPACQMDSRVDAWRDNLCEQSSTHTQCAGSTTRTHLNSDGTPRTGQKEACSIPACSKQVLIDSLGAILGIDGGLKYENVRGDDLVEVTCDWSEDTDFQLECVASCITGYQHDEANYSRIKTCGQNGQWMGPDPNCAPISCAEHMEDEERSYSKTCNEELYDNCEVGCQRGFQGTTIDITCDVEGFRANRPQCVNVECPNVVGDGEGGFPNCQCVAPNYVPTATGNQEWDAASQDWIPCECAVGYARVGGNRKCTRVACPPGATEGSAGTCVCSVAGYTGTSNWDGATRTWSMCTGCSTGYTRAYQEVSMSEIYLEDTETYMQELNATTTEEGEGRRRLQSTQVRLSNGSSGIVEYGSGYICDDSFDQNGAEVICRSLGLGFSEVTFSTSQRVSRATFPIDDLRCDGDERRIEDCSHSTSHNCGTTEGITVTCAGGGTRVALVSANSDGGILQFDGGYVCDDSFETNDARVVCRELGLEYVSYSTRQSLPSSNFTADDVACDGDEAFFSMCSMNTSHNCGSTEGVRVRCSGEAPAPVPTTRAPVPAPTPRPTVRLTSRPTAPTEAPTAPTQRPTPLADPRLHDSATWAYLPKMVMHNGVARHVSVVSEDFETVQLDTGMCNPVVCETEIFTDRDIVNGNEGSYYRSCAGQYQSRCPLSCKAAYNQPNGPLTLFCNADQEWVSETGGDAADVARQLEGLCEEKSCPVSDMTWAREQMSCTACTGANSSCDEDAVAAPGDLCEFGNPEGFRCGNYPTCSMGVWSMTNLTCPCSGTHCTTQGDPVPALVADHVDIQVNEQEQLGLDLYNGCYCKMYAYNEGTDYERRESTDSLGCAQECVNHAECTGYYALPQSSWCTLWLNDACTPPDQRAADLVEMIEEYEAGFNEPIWSCASNGRRLQSSDDSVLHLTGYAAREPGSPIPDSTRRGGNIRGDGISGSSTGGGAGGAGEAPPGELMNNGEGEAVVSLAPHSTISLMVATMTIAFALQL